MIGGFGGGGGGGGTTSLALPLTQTVPIGHGPSGPSIQAPAVTLSLVTVNEELVPEQLTSEIKFTEVPLRGLPFINSQPGLDGLPELHGHQLPSATKAFAEDLLLSVHTRIALVGNVSPVGASFIGVLGSSVNKPSSSQNQFAVSEGSSGLGLAPPIMPI